MISRSMILRLFETIYLSIRAIQSVITSREPLGRLTFHLEVAIRIMSGRRSTP